MSAPLIHETAVVDEGARVGGGTRVWHFTHVSSGSTIGERCVIGQNVFIGSGVGCDDRCRCVSRTELRVHQRADAARAHRAQGPIRAYAGGSRRHGRRQRDHRLRTCPRRLRADWGGQCGHQRRSRARGHGGQPRTPHRLGVPVRRSASRGRRLCPMWRRIRSDGTWLPMGEKR